MYVLQLPKLTFAINNGGSTTQNFEISFPLDFNVGEKGGGGGMVNALLYYNTTPKC